MISINQIFIVIALMLKNHFMTTHNFKQYFDLMPTSFILPQEKTRLLIVGGGRVNGESMFPGPRNGETLGEL